MTSPALAFKIMTDPYVESFFLGCIPEPQDGVHVYNVTKGKKERIGRILMMHANNREEVTEVYAGDIAAAVGLRIQPPGI